MSHISYFSRFLPASAAAGQQVFEVVVVVVVLLLLIKLQKHEKHCINSQKQLMYHRAAISYILLLCFSCFVFFVLLWVFLVEAANLLYYKTLGKLTWACMFS